MSNTVEKKFDKLTYTDIDIDILNEITLNSIVSQFLMTTLEMCLKYIKFSGSVNTSSAKF